MNEMTSRMLVSGLVLALGACGSVSNDRVGADGSPGGGDAPKVISVTPSDGSAGVGPDADIVVTFSKPMDADSVASAWSSDQIPASMSSFSWNADGDVLTATPDQMPIAEGNGLDPGAVDPVTVSFGISSDATDADGVALDAPVSVSFTTVRRMHVDVGADSLLTDSRTASNSAPAAPSVVYAGDTNTDLQVKLVVTFDLPDLPAGATLEQALLSADQSNVGGSPYADLGGMLAGDHVTFGALTDAFAASALSTTGVLSSSPDLVTKSLTVTAAVQDDLAHRAARDSHSQFRFGFSSASNSNQAYDSAQFTRDSLTLSLTYLVD